MLKLKGNAIDYTLAQPKTRVLLHCCNNHGVMGSGIALEVKNRVPDAYQSYKTWCNVTGKESIGDMRIGRDSMDGEIVVANLIAQDGYGTTGERFVNYGRLAEALYKAKNIINNKREYVIPFKMASDRAGGDWNFVIELCKDILGDKYITVVEYSKTNEWD